MYFGYSMLTVEELFTLSMNFLKNWNQDIMKLPYKYIMATHLPYTMRLEKSLEEKRKKEISRQNKKYLKQKATTNISEDEATRVVKQIEKEKAYWEKEKKKQEQLIEKFALYGKEKQSYDVQVLK